MTVSQESLVVRSTREVVQGDPILVPIGITLGALAGAAIGSFKARNQAVRPGLFSGWAGYGTVVGACLGFGLTAGLVGRPRNRAPG